MNFLKSVLLFSFLIIFSTNPFLQTSQIPTVDYVIVGVGTAGALLAKRLTDDKKTSVVALHKGKNLTQDPEIKFTRNATKTVLSALFGILDPELAPLYQTGFTTPQPNANDRELFWVMALPEGGASSINAGAYVRGTAQVYSQWENIAGPLWNINRILNIFKSLEHYHGETDNPYAHGYHGPISVRQEKHPSEVSLKFTQAIINATGFPFVLDYNDPNTPIGASSQIQATQSGPNGALRVSSATAFLNKKVMTPHGFGVDGRRLRVHFQSTALRTLWEGNIAVGVEYLQDGTIKQVYAKKGVIVCAGLFSSPFLMYSGVGPAPLLESLGIPVIFDNPNVGQGLADQAGIAILFTSNPADTPLKTKNGVFDQIAFLPAPGENAAVRQVRFAVVNPIPGLSAALVDLIQPKSRGNIAINSANPLAPPVINEGEFDQPADLMLYQQAFQIYVKNIHLALQAIDPLYRLIIPDPSILDDPVALTNFIKESVFSNESFQSHCRMASFGEGGVVDSTGHVYGVQNLIVADDSIVPMAMDGATMASAYLIAENIARILLNQ